VFNTIKELCNSYIRKFRKGGVRSKKTATLLGGSYFLDRRVQRILNPSRMPMWLQYVVDVIVAGVKEGVAFFILTALRLVVLMVAGFVVSAVVLGIFYSMLTNW